jgi:tetratricopeptide (TPR) repeat protein
MSEAVCAGHPFIALEYAERGNLRDWLDHGWVTRELAGAWAQCVAAGLSYLHEPDPAHLRPAPIAHGNLKPANVLIQGNGVACLTDFGLTSVIAVTSRTAPLSALEYVAPERWRDARDVGTPADVYALGVMLYELFAGRHPLLDPGRGHSQQAWRQAHETLAPQPLRALDPSLPGDLEALALACLAKNPQERPSAREAWERLQGIALDLGTSVWRAPAIVSQSSHNELVYWSNWSAAYAGFERWEEALERNGQALKIALQTAQTLSARGDILVGMQRYDEAEAAYQTALQYARDDAERASLWGQLGTMYNEAGNDERWAEDYKAAIARCEQADASYAMQMELTPGDAGAAFNRAVSQRLWAVAEEGRGQMAAAVQHLKSARTYAAVAVRLGDPVAPGYVRTINDHLRELGESSGNKE